MIQPEDLIGKNVYGIGRAAAMCWIHFGRPVEIDLRGRKRVLGEFALDLDCPWRIRNSRLEHGRRESRYPYLMNGLYQGRPEWAGIPPARKEPEEVRGG